MPTEITKGTTEMKRRHGSITATIPQNQALSDAIEMGPCAMIGLLMPATWDAANIGFKVSATETGTFVPLKDTSGALLEITNPVADTAYVCPVELAPWPWVKVWSQTSGVDTNQTAARSLTIVLKA